MYKDEYISNIYKIGIRLAWPPIGTLIAFYSQYTSNIVTSYTYYYYGHIYDEILVFTLSHEPFSNQKAGVSFILEKSSPKWYEVKQPRRVARTLNHTNKR